MRRPAALPTELPRPAFAVKHAADLIDRNRLRRSDLDIPYRGIRAIAGADLDLVDRCAAVGRMIRSDSYFCGPTAALLWGIPLPGRFESDPRLHIGLPHGERATRLTGTIGHHFVITPDELTRRGSLKLTSPERTWCDLAPYLSLEDLVAAGDRVIWRKDPLAAHERMIELAQRHPGRRGRTTRFAAGQLLSDRSDSRPESRFRVRFRPAGLPTASVNFELYNHAGQLTAILDLAWPDYRVGFDYEGDHHRSDVSQWRRDLTRFPAIEDLGWYAFRAGAVQLDDSTDVIARVSAKLRERGWSSETSV